jgi:hypothetical protein
VRNAAALAASPRQRGAITKAAWRLVTAAGPDSEAVAQDVDIITDPHRKDDDGYNWTRLRFARAVADVLPGSTVIVGSVIGRYPAKVVAWDFEVSDDDPVVTLELLR